MASETDWTSLGEWVVALRGLHHQARLDKLSDDELRRYHEERERRRAARERKVELTIDGRYSETKTLDVGVGGFAVLLTSPARTGQQVEFRLELEPGTAVSARARVVS